jgi:hypothetical protein
MVRFLGAAILVVAACSAFSAPARACACPENSCNSPECYNAGSYNELGTGAACAATCGSAGCQSQTDSNGFQGCGSCCTSTVCEDPTGPSNPWVCCQSSSGGEIFGASCTNGRDPCCLGPCVGSICCGLHNEGACACFENGTSCFDNSQCCSDSCNNGVCMSTDGLGGCTSGQDCPSSVCDITTGTYGVCETSCGKSCITGVPCADGACAGGSCPACSIAVGVSCSTNPGACGDGNLCGIEHEHATGDYCCVPEQGSCVVGDGTCCTTAESQGEPNGCNSNLCCGIESQSCSTQDQCCTGRFCDIFLGADVCLDELGFGCTSGSECFSGICTSGACTCVATSSACGTNGSPSCCSGYCNGTDCEASGVTPGSGGTSCSPTTCPIGSYCAACAPGGAYECDATTNACCIPGSSWQTCTSSSQCCHTANGVEIGCNTYGTETLKVCCNNTAGDACGSSADCCPGLSCDLATFECE